MTKPQVLLQIAGLGDIVVELEHERAPLTTTQFRSLVSLGFYDNTVFHRISPHFTIAGGEQTTHGGAKAAKHTIINESFCRLPNARYTIGLDRKVSRDSVGGGFYINTQDNPRLDYLDSSHEGSGRPVFGRVIRGFEVVDKIANQPCKSQLFQEDQPRHPVVLTRAVELAPHACL